MNSPLESHRLWVLDEAPSTQDIAASALLDLDSSEWPGAVLALQQTAGRGRFNRVWHGQLGSSLAVSFVFHAYPNTAKPWLIGMSVAIATAELFELRLQWPNDLVKNGKKVGGILTELIADRDNRRIPIVGLGLNLLPDAIHPEVAEFAAAVFTPGDAVPELSVLVHAVSLQFSSLPEPEQWDVLRDRWMDLDDTPGKSFRLPNGEEAIAESIGRQGELLARVGGKLCTVLAADAAWGLRSKEP